MIIFIKKLLTIFIFASLKEMNHYSLKKLMFSIIKIIKRIGLHYR